MNILKELIVRENGSDDSEIPEMHVSHLQKLIQKGAKDLEQKWANALHLVQTAYKVAQITRPTPIMKGAWKQYEQLIQYAVEWLAKTRGIKGDWRMSSHVFHESLNNKKYKVVIINNGIKSEYIAEAKSVPSIVKVIHNRVAPDYEVDILEREDGHRIRFYKWGIRQNCRVLISEI